MHKQMQSYYNQVDIEESINRRRFNGQRFAQQQSTTQSHFQESTQANQKISLNHDDNAPKKAA